MESGQVSHARVTITHLEVACEDYREECEAFPLNISNNQDSILKTNGKSAPTVMTALYGLKTSEDENYKNTQFFSFKPKEKNSPGIVRTATSVELLDPWGNPFFIMFDYDGDQTLSNPISGETMTKTRLLIWSLGRDGKSGSDETNQDNIYSWR